MMDPTSRPYRMDTVVLAAMFPYPEFGTAHWLRCVRVVAHPVMHQHPELAGRRRHSHSMQRHCMALDCLLDADGILRVSVVVVMCTACCSRDDCSTPNTRRASSCQQGCALSWPCTVCTQAIRGIIGTQQRWLLRLRCTSTHTAGPLQRLHRPTERPVHRQYQAVLSKQAYSSSP